MLFRNLSAKKALVISLIIVVIDQATKYFFRDSSFSVENTGAAFGILKDSTYLLTIASLIAVFFIVKYFRFYPFALSLILGGTIGNLIDRIFLGHVVDFIDLKVWPVFNIADSANTIGFILLAYALIKKK